MSYSAHISAHSTPQTQKLFGSNQVANSAGGFSFEVSKWTKLDRFLILGCEGGSYYASERKMTLENAQAILDCMREDSVRLVKRIVEISEARRAPKQDPAIFALAIVAGHPQLAGPAGSRMALDSVVRVCTTATHLFAFVEAVQEFRGWGRALRTSVGNWYTSKTADQLAYQLVKYRQRNGWTHRDVLRLSHPATDKADVKALFGWATKATLSEELNPLVHDFLVLQDVKDPEVAIKLLSANSTLTWEMLPTELLASADVWRALLPNIPTTALLRNLGRLTSLGILGPLSAESDSVAEKLVNAKRLPHPISLLSAYKVYEQGHGEKGKLSWRPNSRVVEALEEAFYKSFDQIVPTGKRWLLGLDVSGSMTGSMIAGIPVLSARLGACAMAMVAKRTEQKSHVMGFSRYFIDLGITATDSLASALNKTNKCHFGGTDCSLPMKWALTNKVEVDTFAFYTDNETWAGTPHPVVALREYRKQTGINAKLIVVGMVSNPFTIADPTDSGMLDVVGFDTSAPSVMADFARE